MTNKLNTPILLNDLTIVKLSGTDTNSFLQGQITQDINALSDNSAALAAYCSPRGRVLASMVAVLEQPENPCSVLLITKADNAMAFAQRLRMFVMRSKVNIEILNTQVLGMYDEIDYEPYTVIRSNDYIRIAVPKSPEDETTRYWLIGIGADGATNTTEHKENNNALHQWQAADIRAGLPWVSANNTDTFIPQTINFDLINGLSFTKGCYPGQEVVARSHYRGTIKRRAAYGVVAYEHANALGSADDLVGTDTFNANLPKNPCGRIINAAYTPDSLHLLMEAQLSDLNQADFRVGAANGPAVKIVDLPYSIENKE